MTTRIHTARLDLDIDHYLLRLDGRHVRLTRTEWALLRELTLHAGQTLTYRTLLQRVWGDAYGEEHDYVHTYVRRLRRKLDDPADEPRLIFNEAGIGYRLELPADSSPVPAVPPVRFVNPLPRDAGTRFVGRAREHTLLGDLLDSGARLVSVYGRGGVGKTTLVSRVLAERQRRYTGGVVLSSETGEISLTRLLDALKKLLPPDARAEMDDAPGQGAALLLDALQHGRTLILLDGFEQVQDDTGALRDDALERFLKLAVEQGSGIQWVLTSRLPLRLPPTLKSWERALRLNDGLSDDEGAELLRRCDPDGTAGLRDSTPETLRALSARVGGFPRALEAAAGLLLEDPTLTPAALLADPALVSSEMDALYIGWAIDRLGEQAGYVLETLALYGRPVPAAAVSAVLDNVSSEQAQALLSRLVRALFVQYDAASGRFSLHELDRDHCYRRLSARLSPEARAALHRRAAAYYQGIQPPTLTDAEPFLGEFRQRLAAGDADDAARLLVRLNEGYWRHQVYTDEWFSDYDRLYPQLQDTALKRRLVLHRGAALRGVGKMQEALACYQRIQDSAPDDDERAFALAQSAWVHYDLGDYARALDNWREAAAIYARLGSGQAVGDVLGGLGWVSYLLGDYEHALTCFREAQNLLSEANDTLGVGRNLGDLGHTLVAQGHLQHGIHVLTEALSITAGSAREQSYKGGYLAAAYLLHGDLTRAEQVADRARGFRAWDNDAHLAALHGVILTRLGKAPEALRSFEDALEGAERLLNYGPELYLPRYALALARAGLAALGEGTEAAAHEALDAARARCDRRGVVETYRRLLDALGAPEALKAVLRADDAPASQTPGAAWSPDGVLADLRARR